jgi:ankyrin repeat protein
MRSLPGSITDSAERILLLSILPDIYKSPFDQMVSNRGAFDAPEYFHLTQPSYTDTIVSFSEAIPNANVTSMQYSTAECRPQAIIPRSGNNSVDFSKSLIVMFTEMNIGIGQFSQSNLLRQKHVSQYPARTLFHPDTAELLRDQSLDLQVFHMVVYRLINDGDAISVLQYPATEEDMLFRSSVAHIFLHETRFMGHLIDSTPQPYRDALQKGLFCAAIELGSVLVLNILLSKDFDARIILNFGTRRCYPLERFCARNDVKITQILLERGACPEKHNRENFLRCLNPESSEYFHKDTDRIEIIRLLVQYGVKVCSTAAQYIFKHGDSELFLATTSDSNKHSYKTVISSGRLARALRSPDHCPSLHLKAKVILEHTYPWDVQSRMIWDASLTMSLSMAALRGNVEIFSKLLAAGAHPDTDCLVNAAESKNIAIFESLLDLGLSPTARNSYQSGQPDDSQFGISNPGCSCTAMSVCIEEKFVEAFDLLEHRGFLAKIGDNPINFAASLAAACKICDENLVFRLLSLREVHRTYDLGSAVAAAVKSGNENIVERLLCKGVNPNHESLFLAVEQKNRSLTTLLLHLVILEPRESDSWHDALFEAIRWGDVIIIKDLVKAGISMDHLAYLDVEDKKNKRHMDPLCADLSSDPVWAASPLSLAILRGQHEITSLLLRSGADLNVEDVYLQFDDIQRMSAITACVLKNDYGLLQELLLRGADPFDNSAIHMAILVGNEDITKALLEMFQRNYPSGRKSFGSIALAFAVRHDKYQLIKLLVPYTDQRGLVSSYDLYNKDEAESGEGDISPLGLAIRMSAGDNGGPLSLLLRHLVNLDCIMPTQDHYERTTPLLLAVQFGCLETVNMLIEAGANATLPALWGLTRTPLQAAVHFGREDIVNYLVQRGVDPNEPPGPRAGATSLQLAAIKDFMGIAATLLDNGANINTNVALIDGRTAFEGATEHGRIDMMIFLVQNGAYLHANDQQQFRRSVKFAENNAQHAAKSLAHKLLRSTRAGGGVQLIEQEDVEATGCDLDMSDDFPM